MENVKMRKIVEDLERNPEVARMMMLMLYAILDNEKQYTKDSNTCLDRNAVVEVIVASHLQELNVPVSFLGYNYLKEAIVMTVQHPEMSKSIQKKVYTSIAKKYQTTTMAIARDIRTCLCATWKTGNIAVKKYLKSTISQKTGLPMNVSVIKIIAENVSNEIDSSSKIKHL